MNIETLAHELTVARASVAKFTEAKQKDEAAARAALNSARVHGERLALLAARIDRLTAEIAEDL